MVKKAQASPKEAFRLKAQALALGKLSTSTSHPQILKLKKSRTAHFDDQVVTIDHPPSTGSSTSIDIVSPHALRPNATEKILRTEPNEFDDREKLTMTMRHLDSLMDNVVTVSNEAVDFAISSHGLERRRYYSPSELDGSSDMPHDIPHPQANQSLESFSTVDLESGPSRAAPPPPVPKHQRREIASRAGSRHQAKMKDFAPQLNMEGAAGSYYRDFANHPPVREAPPVPAVTDAFLKAPESLRYRGQERSIESQVSPRTRKPSAPDPWIGMPAADSMPPKTSLKHRSTFPQGEEPYSTNRADFSPSPPHFVETALGHIHPVRRQPIARKWNSFQKRYTALIACLNTFNIGFQIGVYAGLVPQIQYQLGDPDHYALQGNIYLYIGLAISTWIFWPVPLLHGRKPYILTSLAFAIPLQFPQAIIVNTFRNPNNLTFRTGLLISRLLIGFLLGFANINAFTVLLDLFGASLQAEFPHQEVKDVEDVRRFGGGLGMWLGFWTFCSFGSIAIGFSIGAAIINSLNPQWGFYVACLLLVITMAINIITPETRRSAWRRTSQTKDQSISGRRSLLV
ncbi:hypothetical protein BT63DRAFT_287032 [Microthyrium microscopicum]|uniref:MFS general substrate transporter n=1 Tax=Microthyrium microscopicum TaxID=703497 RepID=A0A6A6UA80_9PEZI|nr:hypothetical protein BT63DRAFT_287032 [Microthyrium microscopicum]